MAALTVVYGQRDPAWSRVQLGSVPGATIGAYGCYLSCFAMLAERYGHNGTTPPVLNQCFLDGGLYIAGDLLGDDALEWVFPECRYVGRQDYQTTLADLGALEVLLRDGGGLSNGQQRSVIVEVDFDHDPNDGTQAHFLVALACDGRAVTVADPWWGTVDDLTVHYGPNPGMVLQKYVIYEGPVVTPSTGEPPMPTLTPAELVQVGHLQWGAIPFNPSFAIPAAWLAAEAAGRYLGEPLGAEQDTADGALTVQFFSHGRCVYRKATGETITSGGVKP